MKRTNVYVSKDLSVKCPECFKELKKDAKQVLSNKNDKVNTKCESCGKMFTMKIKFKG